MKLKKIVSVIISAALVFSGGVLGSEKNDVVSAADKARVSVHDPSIFKDKDGTYYVFGSHIDSAKSKDLQNWTLFTNGYATTNNVHFGNLSQNLQKPFAWAGENLEDCDGGFSVWAPDVVYNPDYVNTDGTKGAYMMYFCTSSTYIRSVIAYAVSKTPQGPYTCVDTLIYTGFTQNDSYVTSNDKKKTVNRKYTSTNVDELISSGEVTFNNSWFNEGNYNNQLFPNAIDPTIYYDTSGKMYMVYGSWSGGIFTLEIDKKTGKCIHPKTGTTSDGRMVDSYFGTKISGGYGKSGEGPFIEYNPDNKYYYLWVTYGGLFSDGGYNMRVFRSKSPTGPFTDPAGRNAVLSQSASLDQYGLKVMGNHKFSSLSTAYMACGHNSVLRDDDGKWYLFNHARFNDGSEFHQLRVHSMYFNSQGWPVVAPYEYSGDVMSEGGYDESDIAGDYEFIDHGLATDKNIINYVNIKLNANGTVTGSATGTWSQAADSSAAEIKIGSQTYYGYFMAVQDETGKGKRVMTFSAVGSNNHTIWGVQTKTFTGSDRAAGSFNNGSCWRLKNVNSGLYMQVQDGKAENNANIQQWGTQDGNIHDIWKISSAGEGYYYLSSALGDGGTYMLDVAGKKTANGTNIDLYNFNGGTNQQFRITKNADGSYKLRTRVSGGSSCVEIKDGSVQSGANVQEWEVNGANCQDWIFEAVSDPGCKMDTSVNYTFRNVNSNYVMDIEDGKMAADSNVRQWESNGFDCQKWSLKEFAGGGNYYYIHSVSDPKYVLRANSTADGGNIALAEYSSSDSAMLFKFSKDPDGTYFMASRASKDACLVEVASASREMGANIQQWGPTNNDCQKWTAETFMTSAVTAATTTTTTTTTATTAATTPQPYEPDGDVNGDGSFGIADITALQKWLVNKAELVNWRAADLNGDGRLNVFDLCLMKHRLLGR